MRGRDASNMTTNMNSASIPSTRTPNSPWRSFAPIVLAFIVVALGSRIPLPGLDAAALAEQSAYASDGATARFSIFALGVIPLFTVLAYAEIAKLIFPPLARWQAASSANGDRMSMAIKSVVLVLTAMQGYGILNALAATGLVNGSPSVMIAGIASFVGASAVMIWLADMVRLPNLRNGVWLLLALPLLGALPREFVTSIELVRFGAVSVVDWLIPGVAIAIAVAMVVVAYRLLSGKDGEAASAIPLAVLLWPPFLANIVAGYLIAVPLILAPELLSDAPWFLYAVALALTAILIPLFVYAYYRLFSLDQTDAARRSDTRSTLLAIACVQVLVSVGFGLLTRTLPLPITLNGEMLIVCVSVLLAFRNALDGISPMQKGGSVE